MKILITGGTGFLGLHLGRRLKADGHEVVLAGRNNKRNFQAGRATGCQVIAMDVCRIESVRDIVTEIQPDVIIHAAATKFVDLSEVYPMETVDVNVTGSQNVARVAIERNVDTVIGVSTDKASPPVRNTYGLTKALMERMYCSLNGKSRTQFLCVRYGNVAWSTGSVLPIWRGMLQETGVIGTTGPEMLRFFFTVDEAVALVRTALDHAGELQGKVLSRAMKSAQIEDILKVWIAQVPGSRYEVIQGRPGERNVEYLFGEQELPFTRAQKYGDVMHYIISFNQKVDEPVQEVLSSGNAVRLTDEEIRALINNPPEME
jgi:FlaA1/EpsC-like NDP-sugar epimerase